MGRVFTKKITTDELAGKIQEAWKRHPEFETEQEDAEWNALTLAEQIQHCSSMIGYHYTGITPQVEKDLDKVEFDLSFQFVHDFRG
ncbi:MAG: hypothetical protein QME12_06770 [Nanoarchaeota archaeon]|nr:hypothetical protein [Nanoarchaeota archaeon]